MSISREIERYLAVSSPIRKLFEEGERLRREGREVFDFSLGNPVLPPPPQLYRALERVVEERPAGLHRYMSNLGSGPAREAVAQMLTSELNEPFPPEFIALTVGAAGGLNQILRVLLDPGDEVVLFSPYFVEYLFYLDNFRAEVKVLDTAPTFQLPLDKIESQLSERTKVILLNTPNNPSSKIYPSEDLSALSELLLRFQRESGRTIYLINDSPYRRLVFSPENYREVLSLYPHSILVSSFSKDLSIPGERLGFVAVNPSAEAAREIMSGLNFTARSLGFVNAPALMQAVLPEIIDAPPPVEHYRESCQRLLSSLKEMGYQIVEPDAAFYLFCRAPGGDDAAFCNHLKEFGILAVPGKGFGTPGYFRLSYCVSRDTIERSIPKFAEAMSEWRVVNDER